MQIVRWGIVGTGGIAHRFAEAAKNVEGVSLEAVASRNDGTARQFADEFGIPHPFGSYEDMARFDGIDAAYIATPHALHAPNGMLMMNHGKAVLSEKPITVNMLQLDEMIACAQKNKVFLMEAMWARLTPGTIKLLEIVKSGAIGEVKGIQAAFCYDMSDEPDHHAFNPLYGGGSLLDVGCYCLSFASWNMDSPVADIVAEAELGPTGVDVHCCVLIKYASGAIASLTSAMLLEKPGDGYVFGDKGYIKTKDRFYAPQEFTVHVRDSKPQTYRCPFLGNGFEEQIIESSRCIREGKLESDIVPHSQSRFIMAQMDAIRRQIGVRYPLDPA
ncbi:MAG TPA: Gfo/Idh/MocA family oxidoreductase [Clostridiales bacterium]|nr:MAG: 1,5-anhydro-D-fructose reductase [Firmicutes bacterium ADurb.Bin262]HOU09240.1 Gfo/Idh/MocA family oxidoreductase [Clostridiales bacterium]HQH64252.1 Gfo/Idh/MocA family oxidoreductase [Clostridiales bacterium]HQK72690.1 Gfo/Idh/MocA family oxidoreductase [Clostridiales bacterium]